MARTANRARRTRRGPSLSTVLMVCLFLLGAGIMAYPTFSDWWNSYHQSRAIATYASHVDEMDPKVIEGMLADAEDYNAKLLYDDNRYVVEGEKKAEYESLLDIDGTGVMGYVQIARLKIDYPIYHGVDESVLQEAIGHLAGTSLPVGGKSTHAVITGHRGLPRAKLFTDLDKMVEGDTFTVTVLGKTITYQVDQIRIVDPSDLSDLELASGKDYMTLITCTPYGINTHRLLVRGHRIDNLSNTLAIAAEAVQIPNYVAVPAVGLPMLFAYLAGTLIYYRFNRGYDKDTVMQALNNMKDGEGQDGEQT